MPIYILISQVDYTIPNFYMRKILRVIPCTIETYQETWDREFIPLYNMGIGIEGHIFSREPDSIIREMAAKEESTK